LEYLSFFSAMIRTFSVRADRFADVLRKHNFDKVSPATSGWRHIVSGSEGIQGRKSTSITQWSWEFRFPGSSSFGSTFVRDQMRRSRRSTSQSYISSKSSITIADLDVGIRSCRFSRVSASRSSFCGGDRNLMMRTWKVDLCGSKVREHPTWVRSACTGSDFINRLLAYLSRAVRARLRENS